MYARRNRQEFVVKIQRSQPTSRRFRSRRYGIYSHHFFAGSGSLFKIIDYNEQWKQMAISDIFLKESLSRSSGFYISISISRCLHSKRTQQRYRLHSVSTLAVTLFTATLDLQPWTGNRVSEHCRCPQLYLFVFFIQLPGLHYTHSHFVC